MENSHSPYDFDNPYNHICDFDFHVKDAINKMMDKFLDRIIYLSYSNKNNNNNDKFEEYEKQLNFDLRILLNKDDHFKSFMLKIATLRNGIRNTQDLNEFDNIIQEIKTRCEQFNQDGTRWY